MSYDHWKTTEAVPFYDQDEPHEETFEDLEVTAAMLGVTVDEYLANKSLDRWLGRHQGDDPDELPF
jgi:hypothetical protein